MADGDTESQHLTWSAAALGGGGLYLVTTMVTWQMGPLSLTHTDATYLVSNELKVWFY